MNKINIPSKLVLVDRFFITQEGTNKLLDKSYQFNAIAPFSADVYVSETEAAASALIVSQNLIDCSVIKIPRYIQKS